MENKTIPITEQKHIFVLGKLTALGVAFDDLQGKYAPDKPRPAGYTLAEAILQRHMSEARSRWATFALRMAAKDGVDINHPDLSLSVQTDEEGKHVLLVRYDALPKDEG